MITFSDANPVQFWLIDCDTYNEEERFGIYPRCFCAPWECDDEIKTQFQDIAGQNFSLLIYDENDSLLDSIPVSETEDGVYLVSFTPTDNTPDFCEKKVQLQVRREAGQQGIVLPDLTEWANNPGAGDDWSTGSTPSVTRFGIGNTDIVFVDYAFIEGSVYQLTLTYQATGLAETVISFRVMDNSFTTLFNNGTAFDGDQNGTIQLSFTATAASTKMGVRVALASNESETVTITDVTATVQVGSSEIVAKSDCLDVKAEQEGTILIQYSNYRNYAGIINNNGSPDLNLYLRIPAVFNEERYPETDEPLQLSNNRIISLNSQVKKQRLLETDQMPNYMHLKTQLALKHQFVTIEDVDYIKEEPYEQVENSNKRWPMRRYTCWLTEKEYVIRNIL